MIGALAARNNLRVKNARQPEKMFKCLGQGHKNKENRETHTNSEVNYQYIKRLKIDTLQNSIISILKLPRQCRDV